MTTTRQFHYKLKLLRIANKRIAVELITALTNPFFRNQYYLTKKLNSSLTQFMRNTNSTSS